MQLIADNARIELNRPEFCLLELSAASQVNAVLSQKISGELDNQVKQQALFQLLGEDYVRIHFPHHKYNPGTIWFQHQFVQFDAKITIFSQPFWTISVPS